MSASSSTAASSSSSSLRTSVNNTASSTPGQSPMPHQGRTRSTQSSPKTWSGETTSGRRERRDARNRETNGMAALMSGTTTAEQQDAGSSLLDFPTATRTTTGSSSKSSASVSRDQWWENVLPPGQLAERLRRAQATPRAVARSAGQLALSGSASLSSAVTGAEEGPRSSRKSILRNATPSERKIWTSLADYGREEERPAGEHSHSVATSTRSSMGSVVSMRSDRSSSLSGGSSGTEDSPLDGRSLGGKEDMPIHYGDRSNTASPISTHSISRSRTCRRSRIMGDGGDRPVGLGIGAKDSELDERFRQWNSNLPFQISTAVVAPPAHYKSRLRPFPSGISGRQSPAHILTDTPEASSAEEHDEDSRSTASSTTTTTTMRRVTRSSSSVKSVETVAAEPVFTPVSNKRLSMPALGSSSSQPLLWTAQQRQHGHHSRHVSFNQDVEVSADEQPWQSHSVGRHAGRSHSLLNDTSGKRRTWQPQSAKPFLPLASDGLQQESAQFSIRGKRMPCHSAPTSPRSALHSLEGDKGNKLRTELDLAPTPANDLALLSSLGIAQTPLSSAGNLALTLTRHLSVPLRPMLHLTMFLSISSFTFFALAGFLIAGYLITAWDDVNHRGKRIQANVGNAKRTFDSGVQWFERMLCAEPAETEGQNDAASKQSTAHHRRSSSRIVTAPIRLAFAVPVTIAYKLTPTSVSESLGYGGARPDGTSLPRPTPSSMGSGPPRASSHSPDSSLPPRPPLSSLLPSILLTVVIALGAGLASFFAQRATSSPRSSSPVAFPGPSPSASRPKTPLAHPSSQIPLRKRGSTASQHGRKQSYSSSLHGDRRAYDAVPL